MIRTICKVCVPVMSKRNMKGVFAIDFCMRVLIAFQPALALPVFINLMLTAYEAGKFKAMALYAVIWFVMGGLFLAGRYWFDIAVNGKFYNKAIETIRDTCLGAIYNKNRSVDAGYDANPYFAFLRDGVELFVLVLFRIDRLAAIFLVAAAFFLWLLQISMGMAMLTLVGGIISVWAGNLASKKLNEANEAMFQQKTKLNGTLRNLFYGTEHYLVKGKYRQLKKEFEDKIMEYNRQGCKNAGKAGARRNMLRMIDCTVYIIMILWCNCFLHEKSGAVILTMISAYETMKGYVNELNSAWMMIAEKKYVVERYDDIINPEILESEQVMAKGQALPKEQILSNEHVIEIRHLCYRAGETEILRDINLEISQNEKVALIGLNGAGKSTLLKCILQLIQPIGGELRVKAPFVCSYIPVQPQLFPVSIIENIGYASEEYTAERDTSHSKALDITDILEAADVARIDSIDFYEELEEGDETLSGGEAQRVAIARAFAMSGRIMIADEPTANLDIQTERKVMAELLKRSDTLIYTTHNPALVNLADKVYIMKKGRIAACGTPQEVNNLPVYREWEQNVREG